MAESNSIPGRKKINHEARDTLRRTITIKTGGVLVNLTGSSIVVIFSDTEGGDPYIPALVVGNGILASDLINGQFKIRFQTAGVFFSKDEFWYRIVITDAAGTIKTYVEDKIKFT